MTLNELIEMYENCTKDKRDEIFIDRVFTIDDVENMMYDEGIPTNEFTKAEKLAILRDVLSAHEGSDNVVILNYIGVAVERLHDRKLEQQKEKKQ